MPKFKVERTDDVTESATLEFEADTPEEALAKAMDDTGIWVGADFQHDGEVFGHTYQVGIGPVGSEGENDMLSQSELLQLRMEERGKVPHDQG